MAPLSLLFLVAISLCITSGEENQTFYLAFPPVLSAFATRYAEARLVITTSSSINISYTVTVNNQLISMGSVNVEHSKEILINKVFNGTEKKKNTAENFTIDNSFERRDKGITVTAAGSVSVMAYISLGRTSLSTFNVLPYKRYPTLTEYKYYGIGASTIKINTSESTFEICNSLMLLVGSDNNTVVQLKPSTNISLPANIQEESKNIVIKAGMTHSFTLHQGQTLLLKGDDDLSGTEIISNQPLTVISGHECARVPENTGGCDQILAHIPPTVTWGKHFVLQPFSGRSSGQLIKVISSNNETYVHHSCIGDSLRVTKLSSGDTMEFNSPSSTKACMISSDKPILVAQVSKGPDTDGLGDLSMMIVPPLEQYQPQQLSIKSLPKHFSDRQYINVIVLAQNFNKSHVHLNDKPIDCDWSIVYAINSTDNVLAYTCTTLINSDDVHTVTSEFPSAVMVYGFRFHEKKSYTDSSGYAYSTGSAMLPLNAVIQVKFSVGEYQVMESDHFVTVEIWRMDNITQRAQVLVTTASGTAMSGIDFVGIEETMTFEIGEMHKKINISITDDEWTEELEQFFVIVRPLAQLSSYLFHQATIQIVDDDDLKIGFSTFPDPAGGTTSLQVDTFGGKLPADVPALVYLKIQFLTSDMASIYSQHINISNNVTSITIPCSPYCDKENSTLIGVLELIDSERVNITHIQLSPSFAILHVAPTPAPIVYTPPQETPLPVIMSLPIQKSVPSTGTLVIVGILSSFITLIFSMLIGLFCCYLSYKYGKEYGYRYEYTTAKKTDRFAIETEYFVQTLNDTSF